jgi:hypothetical protein
MTGMKKSHFEYRIDPASLATAMEGGCALEPDAERCVCCGKALDAETAAAPPKNGWTETQRSFEASVPRRILFSAVTALAGTVVVLPYVLFMAVLKDAAQNLVAKFLESAAGKVREARGVRSVGSILFLRYLRFAGERCRACSRKRTGAIVAFALGICAFLTAYFFHVLIRLSGGGGWSAPVLACYYGLPLLGLVAALFLSLRGHDGFGPRLRFGRDGGMNLRMATEWKNAPRGVTGPLPAKAPAPYRALLLALASYACLAGGFMAAMGIGQREAYRVEAASTALVDGARAAVLGDLGLSLGEIFPYAPGISWSADVRADPPEAVISIAPGFLGDSGKFGESEVASYELRFAAAGGPPEPEAESMLTFSPSSILVLLEDRAKPTAPAVRYAARREALSELIDAFMLLAVSAQYADPEEGGVGVAAVLLEAKLATEYFEPRP